MTQLTKIYGQLCWAVMYVSSYFKTQLSGWLLCCINALATQMLSTAAPEFTEANVVTNNVSKSLRTVQCANMSS